MSRKTCTPSTTEHEPADCGARQCWHHHWALRFLAHPQLPQRRREACAGAGMACHGEAATVETGRR
eukprot:9473820-Pyramimonas_sp.AAC.1